MIVARTRLALAVAAAAAVVVVWIGGLIGLAQYAEDLCFADAELLGYGGYTQTVQAWPPSVQCVLRSGWEQPGLTVDHRLLGAAISTWRYIFPPVAAVGLSLMAGAPFMRRGVRIAAGR